jgi:hypothetical protein
MKPSACSNSLFYYRKAKCENTMDFISCETFQQRKQSINVFSSFLLFFSLNVCLWEFFLRIVVELRLESRWSELDKVFF